jgi:hypothetical protein
MGQDTCSDYRDVIAFRWGDLLTCWHSNSTRRPEVMLTLLAREVTALTRS